MGFTAALYDTVLWRGERQGMRERRAGALAHAYGRTLEIGAGTGLNIDHYPSAVTELVLTEPFKKMSVRLQKRAADRPNTSIVTAGAEALPFPDDSFDTVVSTLVFCTIEDPEKAAGEVARVLKPGGQMLFIEHIRSDDEKLARKQDRYHKPWKAFGDGCNCNRRFVDLISASLPVETIEEQTWTGMPSIVRPIVVGRARVHA